VGDAQSESIFADMISADSYERKFRAPQEKVQRTSDCRSVATIGKARPLKGATPIVTAAEDKPRLRALTAAEFLGLSLPLRQMVLEPWLPEKGLAMLYSPRDVGKTLLGLTSAYVIAVGAAFIGFHAPEPRRVLYIDGEMPARTMQERLSRIAKGFDRELPNDEYFRILCADICEFGLPGLATVEGQARIDAEVQDASVIFVDNLSTLVRSGKENEAEGWLQIQEWALRHRRAGRSVVLLHHAGKGGAQRGTSRREDVFDTVIALRRPADYSP
jgi:hypothetical protein